MKRPQRKHPLLHWILLPRNRPRRKRSLPIVACLSVAIATVVNRCHIAYSMHVTILSPSAPHPFLSSHIVKFSAYFSTHLPTHPLWFDHCVNIWRKVIFITPHYVILFIRLLFPVRISLKHSPVPRKSVAGTRLHVHRVLTFLHLQNLFYITELLLHCNSLSSMWSFVICRKFWSGIQRIPSPTKGRKEKKAKCLVGNCRSENNT
jgi:hypothetical protein